MDHFQAPFGVETIKKLIPHRYPFLLIDRVLKYELNDTIVAQKAVSYSDHYLQGHFPSNPILPGVIQVEGMAQAAGVLGSLSTEGKQLTCRLADISEARFRREVVPGDTIVYSIKTVKVRSSFFWYEAEALVNGEVVSNAKFSAKMG